ncbi:MAG: hypothetical protein IKN63_04635 [Bacilli bacterium]|nr:hypothetical protein [Bacilli bacterium]
MNNEKINESINELKEKFNRIKQIPFHQSLRKGSTGIGYTFEKLIGKEEDSSYDPDYKGIEIKTKYGYSKSPISLFNLVGKRDDEVPICNYLINKFGYYVNDNKKEKALYGEIYTNKLTRVNSSFLWKLKIDLKENILKLNIINNNLNIIDDSIYWNLSDISERLLTKLSYMALVKGYPYTYKKELYYKYTNLNIYKLKGFKEFLKLLENGKIIVCVAISYNTLNDKVKLKDRNISFRLDIDYINYLYTKIY